jgi:hypothetical protein
MWLILGVVSCGLILALLSMRQGINSSARDLILEVAEENAEFYKELVDNRWLVIEPPE